MTATGDPRTDPPGDDDTAPGLSALYAALASTARHHDLDALALAVDDPELGRQTFAAGADIAAVRVALRAVGQDRTRSWWAAPEPGAPPPELHALSALARTALRLVVADESADPGSSLEVFVRRLPHVTAVARTGAVIEAWVDPAHGDEVVRRLGAVAALEGIGAVVLRTGTPLAEPAAVGDAGPEGPVELVTVRTVPESGELEVHVRDARRRTIGRAPLARTLQGAAEAALEALTALDPDRAGTRRVGWVRTIDTTAEREFLVALKIRTEQGSTHYGIAAGASPVEAAARAALHACHHGTDQPTRH